MRTGSPRDILRLVLVSYLTRCTAGAQVLVVGMRGLAAEVCKNIVLAGAFFSTSDAHCLSLLLRTAPCPLPLVIVHLRLALVSTRPIALTIA